MKNDSESFESQNLIFHSPNLSSINNFAITKLFNTSIFECFKLRPLASTVHLNKAHSLQSILPNAYSVNFSALQKMYVLADGDLIFFNMVSPLKKRVDHALLAWKALDTWGQFHQSYGAKRKCPGSHYSGAFQSLKLGQYSNSFWKSLKIFVIWPQIRIWICSNITSLFEFEFEIWIIQI